MLPLSPGTPSGAIYQPRAINVTGCISQPVTKAGVLKSQGKMNAWFVVKVRLKINENARKIVVFCVEYTYLINMF